MKKEWTGLGRSSSVVQVNLAFVCMMLMALMISAQMYVSARLLANSYVDDIDAFYQAGALRSNLVQCDEAMAAYLRSGNRANLVRYNEGTALFQKSWDELGRLCGTAQELSLLRSIRDAFYSYQSSSNLAALSFWEGDMQRSYQNLGEAQSISQYLGGYCDTLLNARIDTSYGRSLDMRRVQHVTLGIQWAVLFLLGGIMALGVWSLIDSFDRPLARLYEVCLKVSQGSYQVRVPEDCRDRTMQLLARTFNAMTGSIQTMIRNLEEKKQIETQLLNEQLKSAQYEKLLEQAHFLALQTQTNPHFLFNTLNVISRTITLERSDEALTMIDSLALLLRYNLQDASVPANLAQELAVVKEYLSIQQCRFPDRFEVSFEYDETYARTVQIPRFTLQPMVENAVLHGLEPKLGPGRLQIRVARGEDGWCEVRIQDDGVGMSAGALDSLMNGQGPDRKGQVNAIGIANTRRRLEIFTHSRQVFSIHSEPGRGTLILLRIPPEPRPPQAKQEEPVCISS